MNSADAFSHPTRAIINLTAFRQNLSTARSYLGGGVRIMAMVKANAYGHGSLRIAAEAAQHGAEYLAVARVPEGAELRTAGITRPMLILEFVPDDHIETAIFHDMDLTVGTIERARLFDLIAHRLGRKVRVHVKVDTGMGRLGLDSAVGADLIESIARLPSTELMGVYSHFATAENPDQTYAREQLQRFQNLLDELHRRRIEIPLKHMANSAAILSLPDSHFDIVRPGLMLYGYPPRVGMHLKTPLFPVMSLESKVMFLKTVEPKTSISYGRRYYTAERTRIATVPVGYGDGYPRLLTGKSEALIRGRRYPVVGTICMDQIMIDIGPDGDVEEGDKVTLMGTDGKETISCWDLAERVGTIPYEIMSLIPPRVPRIFGP